jgi:hypothetical protein
MCGEHWPGKARRGAAAWVNKSRGGFGARSGGFWWGKARFGEAGQVLPFVGLTVGGGFWGAVRCGTRRRGKARFYERHNE